MTTITPSKTSTMPPAQPSRSLVRDIRIVMTRELKPVLRDPFSLLFGMIQPLVFLALFGPLLSGSMGGTFGDGVWQWFVPSILVMTTLFGTSTTGANLLFEFQTGAHERMLVTPLRRPALLLGRALKEIVPMLAQAVIIVAVTIPFGYELHVVGTLIGLLILAAFCVGVGALSYTLALASKDQEWLFWTVQQTLLFPVLLLAGMLLPVEGGPGWLQTLSSFNPLTYVVDAARILFNGEIASSTVAYGIIAAAIVAAFGLLVGTRAMKRSA